MGIKDVWKWILIYTLDVTKFKFIILSVDSVNVQVPNQILKYKLDKTEDLDGNSSDGRR